MSFSGLTKEELDSDNFEELICGLCLNREDVKFIRKYSIANKDIIKSSDTCKLPREDNTGQTEGSIFRKWFLQIYNYKSQFFPSLEILKCKFIPWRNFFCGIIFVTIFKFNVSD